ncbi:unnamed protein product [Arctogadus glacialis]
MDSETSVASPSPQMWRPRRFRSGTTAVRAAEEEVTPEPLEGSYPGRPLDWSVPPACVCSALPRRGGWGGGGVRADDGVFEAPRSPGDETGRSPSAGAVESVFPRGDLRLDMITKRTGILRSSDG